MSVVRVRSLYRALPALVLLVIACGWSLAEPTGLDDENGNGGPPPAVYCPDLPSGVEHGFVGDPGSAPAAAGTSRIVLMGGSSEVDPASKLFVEAAAGGDVLVMRASGSVMSYNNYFRSNVNPVPRPAAVSSIRIDQSTSGVAPGVLCHVSRANALWLAGGNQWNYLGVWPVELQDSIRAVGLRGGIGGTSAGAAALGEFAFDAAGGGVTSGEALQDPFGPRISVSRSPLGQPALAGWIVDQHFRERDREGRLLVFLARMQQDLERDTVYAVGLDERAALVVEGDHFTVLAHPGRAASFYRTTHRTSIEAGRPLDMEGVERVLLYNQATGSWPFDFEAWRRDTVSVTSGVVSASVSPGAGG